MVGVISIESAIYQQKEAKVIEEVCGGMWVDEVRISLNKNLGEFEG